MCIGHHHQDDAELSSPSPAKLSKTENGARHDSNHIPSSLEIHSPNSSPSVVTVRALAIHHKNTRDTTGEEGKGRLVVVACIDLFTVLLAWHNFQKWRIKCKLLNATYSKRPLIAQIFHGFAENCYFYLAHRIHQPILKLKILKYHQFFSWNLLVLIWSKLFVANLQDFHELWSSLH